MLTLNYNQNDYSIIKFVGKKHQDSVKNLTPPTKFQKIMIPVINRVGKPFPNLVEVLFVKPRETK